MTTMSTYRYTGRKERSPTVKMSLIEASSCSVFPPSTEVPNVGKWKTCWSLFRIKNVCSIVFFWSGTPPPLCLPSWHHSHDKCRWGLPPPCLHVVSNQKLWWRVAKMTWMKAPSPLQTPTGLESKEHIRLADGMVELIHSQCHFPERFTLSIDPFLSIQAVYARHWNFSLNFSLSFIDLQCDVIPWEPNAQKGVYIYSDLSLCFTVVSVG